MPSATSRASDTPVVDHVPGGGPDGGAVWSLAILATRPAIVFAALENGGVYTSSDRGQTWTPADRGLPSEMPCDLIASPDASAVYAACFVGLYKTTNRGGLWQQLDVDDPEPPAIALSSPRVLYQPPLYGVVRSRDGGRRWQHVPATTPTKCGSAFAIDPSDPFTLFCGDDQWIKVSRNGGRTWARLSRASQPDTDITGLAIDPSNRLTLVAGTSDGQTFKSTDGGATWHSGADGPATGPIEALAFVDGTGGILFARQDSTILRSLDAGDHWEALPVGWGNQSLRTFAVDPSSPSTVYVATRRGVMMTTDLGLHWEVRRRGMTRASVSLAFAPGTPTTLYARTVDDTFASRDGGATWSHSERDLAAASADRSPMLKTTTDGFEYSTDGGNNWRTGRLPNGEAPTGIAIAAGDPRTIYVSTGGLLGPALKTNAIWRTLDGGENWQIVDRPPVGSIGFCCGLIADPNDRNTVYAIVGGVGIDGGSEIRRTKDGGLAWTELAVGGLSYATAVSPTVPTTLIVQAYDATGAARFTLMISTDRGEHWTRGGAGLPDVQLTNIVADPRRPTHLFAGTNGRGVFRSTDAGATWQPTGSGR